MTEIRDPAEVARRLGERARRTIGELAGMALVPILPTDGPAPDHWHDEGSVEEIACVCRECSDVCGPAVHAGWICRECSRAQDGGNRGPCHPDHP